MTGTGAVPPDWGDDDLSNFLQQAERNRYATFIHKTEAYGLLSAIDEAFSIISKGWINPQSEIAALLFIRCHGAYRAAVGAAMAGQVVEAFILQRGALEAAAYALHVQRSPNLAIVWLKRHDSEKDLAAAKSAFTIGAVKKTIQAADRKAAEVFAALYSRTVDHGGHPNAQSILGNATLVREASHSTAEHILLQGDGLPLDFGLRSTAQVGVCCLDILECAFRARFELLGVRHALIALREGL